MPITYLDIAGPTAGADNMGGTKQFIYWANKDLFVTVGALPASPTTFDQLVKITSDHTFGVSDGFVKIYCTHDMGELNAETVGDLDGRSVRPTVTIFIPGDDAVAMGQIKQMTQDMGIVLVPLITAQGATKYIQIGTEDLWAYVTSSFASGKNSEGTKGTTLEITSNQPGWLEYAGTVTEKA